MHYMRLNGGKVLFFKRATIFLKIRNLIGEKYFFVDRILCKMTSLLNDKRKKAFNSDRLKTSSYENTGRKLLSKQRKRKSPVIDRYD